MKIRKYVLLSILLFLLFLLWQICLIIVSLKENLTGINFNSVDVEKNTNDSTIPRIIHQMWKSEDLSTYPIANSHSQWKKSYPNYEIRLWTDEDLEEIMRSDEYKHLNEIYKSYSYSIERADLGRLVIIHREGGIYADLDVFPSSKSIDTLLHSNMSLIIPRSFTGSSLINHFFIAQKSSKILHFILHQIKSKKFYEKIYLSPYLEVFSQGSFFLTRSIKKYLQLSKENEDHLWILSEKELEKYISHHTGRSWHLLDGFILNQIDARPKLFLAIATLSLFCILLFLKWKFSFNK